MTRRNVLFLSVAVVLVVALLTTAAVLGRDDVPAVDQEPTGEKAPDGLSAFYAQKLDWEDCANAQCTWVKVPIDYEKPGGKTTRLRVKVIPSKGDGGRNLFVNPGGPGGSALDFADYLSSGLGDSVLDAYDIVGVDPRGVGKSNPVTCLSDAKFDSFAAADPTPDDADEIADLRSDFRTLGEGCIDKSGELAAHVSTEEAARDMDVVRALLGSTRFDWFGASYGTQLGATYATLFPDKVGRMVLDGAIDPELSGEQMALGQATGFHRALTAYVKDCVQKSSCPLGSDPDRAVRAVSQLLDRADAKPLKTGTDRELTEGLMFYGIAVTLYDKKTWPVLTQAFSQAIKGDGSVLLRLSNAYFERNDDGSYSGNIGQVIYAIGCLDSDERGSVADVKQAIPRFEKVAPVFGRALAWGVLGCSGWPIKATHPQVTIDAADSAPIVVLGTTRDPATPYEWSQSLTDELGSAVLVTRDGDGHTAYSSGNTCITDLVDAYLVKGTVPKDGTTCKEQGS